MLGTPMGAMSPPNIQTSGGPMTGTGAIAGQSMASPNMAPRPYSGDMAYTPGQATFSPTPQSGLANPFAYNYQGNAAYKQIDASSPGMATLLQGQSPQQQTSILNSYNQSAQTQANQAAQNQLNQMGNAFSFYAGAQGYNPAATYTNPLTGQQVTGASQQFLDALGATNKQIGALGQQTDLSKQGLQQQYDLNLQKSNIQKGANQKDIGSLQAELGDINNLMNSQMGSQKYAAEMQQRKETSDAVANGALQTGGARQGMNDIASQLASQLQQTQLSKDIQAQRYNRQLNQAQTQAQMYDLAPKDYLNQLQLGLNRLGLDQTMKVDDLLNGLNSASAEDRAKSLAITQNAMQGYQAFPTTSSLPKRAS